MPKKIKETAKQAKETHEDQDTQDLLGTDMYAKKPRKKLKVICLKNALLSCWALYVCARVCVCVCTRSSKSFCAMRKKKKILGNIFRKTLEQLSLIFVWGGLTAYARCICVCVYVCVMSGV